MTPEQIAMQADVDWLDKGDAWLSDPANKTSPRYKALEDAWLARLAQYCQCYRLVVLGAAS